MHTFCIVNFVVLFVNGNEAIFASIFKSYVPTYRCFALGEFVELRTNLYDK